MNQSFRSTAAASIGALVVAIAALSVHNGPVAAAPTDARPLTNVARAYTHSVIIGGQRLAVSQRVYDILRARLSP